MNEIIQCPTCSKKYRLPASVPPTFTCRNCDTVMDLSGFQAEAPVEPAVPEGPAGGAPRARHGRGRGRGRAPTRQARGGRGARGRRGRGGYAEDDYYEEEHHGRPHYRRQETNPALIWGSLAGVVIAVVLLIVYMKSQGDEPADEGTNNAGTNESGPAIPGTTPPGPGMTPSLPGTPGAGTSPVQPGPGSTPGGTPGQPEGNGGEQPAQPEVSLEKLPVPEGKTYYPSSRAEIQTYPWPEDVTGEERNKIDEAVHNALEVGGRDGLEAEEYLVSMDLKAAGRLISEFVRVKTEYGLTDPEGLARMMVIDRTLRKIDGVMERFFNHRDSIKPVTPESQVMWVLKRWNWWWDLERYRRRYEPWDPRVDEDDPDAEGNEED
ncbi:MAG: hypothetical protein ACYTG6_12865 [Planctomycetota bacterium]|jgi:hypothetical protein